MARHNLNQLGLATFAAATLEGELDWTGQRRALQAAKGNLRNTTVCICIEKKRLDD